MGLAATITRALTRPPEQRAAGTSVASRPVTGTGYGFAGSATGAGGMGGLDLGALYGAAGRRGQSAAAAYRCVQLIASNLAGVPFQVVRGDEPVDQHPVARLFEQPSGHLSGRSMKEVMFARCEWRGQTFVYLDRGPTGEGEVAAAFPIYAPCAPVVRRTDAGEEVLDGFQVRLSGGVKVGLLPSEVLWLRYPDPDDAWGALAPWKAAAHAAEVDELAREWQREELAHGGRPAGVVYLGDVDEATYAKAQAAWRQVASGPRSSSRHLLLAGEVEPSLKRLSFTAAEMGYLESRKWNLEETALAFGVPRDLVLGGSTFDNQRAAKVALWSDLLRPKMEVLASEVDRQLLPDTAEEAGFDVSEVEALRENLDAIWTRAKLGLEAEALTVDEGRELLGYDALPGGIGAVTLSVYRATQGGHAAPGEVARAVLGALAGQRSRITVGGRRGLRVLPPARLVVPAQRVVVPGTVVPGTVVPGTVVPALPAVPAQRAAAPSDRPVAATLRAYDRHETAGRRAVSRLADAMEKDVMRRWRKATERARVGDDDVVLRWEAGGSAGRIGPGLVMASGREVRVGINDLLDPGFWEAKTRDQLEGWISATWDEGGATLAARLGVDFTVFHDQVLAAMGNRLQVLSEQVTDTTRTAIESGVLADGVAEGKSIPDLTADLTAVFTDLRSNRATTIARTETVGGFNSASRAIAVASGVVTSREWLATSDGRTRESHAELDGYRTDSMDDAYPNGVMHPGDPHGDPSETVNCRCVETYVLADDTTTDAPADSGDE